jgi:hypothetical protein
MPLNVLALKVTKTKILNIYYRDIDYCENFTLNPFRVYDHPSVGYPGFHPGLFTLSHFVAEILLI